MTKYYYEMIATYKSMNKSEITYENAENEWSKINVYFKDLDYIYINDSPVYTLTDLFIAFSGNIGLFCGISLLTFIEFFEFLIRFIYEYCKHSDEIRPIRTRIKLNGLRSINK